MYYLQSRYYDPAIGRFVNADAYSSTGQGVLGHNMFAYCGNNPIVRKDEDGKAFETIFDIASLAVSALEVAANPADLSAWASLLGDTIDLVPFVTGVGETIRALRTADKVVDGAGNVIDTYRKLKKADIGLDLEVHHIVEKRFAKQLGFSKSGGKMPSIALSKAQHRIYTNMWRRELPYGSKYSNQQILRTAARIYADNPKLMGAVIFSLTK